MATVVFMVPGWQLKVRRALDPHLDRVAGLIAADTRSNIVRGGHVVTGQMLVSVKARDNKVFIGTDHWHYVEYGTRPHLIRVRARRVLSDRMRVFGTTVQHPGNPPYAPVTRALYKRRVL